ncbi:unnamed protein product [Caenorhabditis sp. 36 PRJEB53466]|nr:unnamed protein product [Caenorhabditis sp. 36 PRJEB53466]
MVVPDFNAIQGERYNHNFAADSILFRGVDEHATHKLLTKQDLSCLKRLLVKFRLHLKESHEDIEKYGKEDILFDHAVFINDQMIKRTESLQAAAKHEKDKNARSDNFMAAVGLFKKGLQAFESQQAALRRHQARLAYSRTPEGAAYFKEKAREELTVIVQERLKEYERKEAEMAAEKAKLENGLDDERIGKVSTIPEEDETVAEQEQAEEEEKNDE